VACATHSYFGIQVELHLPKYKSSPAGTAENKQADNSFAPAGLDFISAFYPQLKLRAIFGRAFGAHDFLAGVFSCVRNQIETERGNSRINFN
jgi:hypothetical protein